MTTAGHYGDTDHHGATAVTTGPGIVLITVLGTVLTTPLVTVLTTPLVTVLTTPLVTVLTTPLVTVLTRVAGHDEPAGFLIATERV
jgi:hypothetical protein